MMVIGVFGLTPGSSTAGLAVLPAVLGVGITRAAESPDV